MHGDVGNITVCRVGGAKKRATCAWTMAGASSVTLPAPSALFWKVPCISDEVSQHKWGSQSCLIGSRGLSHHERGEQAGCNHSKNHRTTVEEQGRAWQVCREAVGRETFDLNHLPLGQVQKRSLKHVLVNVIVFKVISFFVCFCFIKTPGTQESLSGHNEQHLHYFSSVPFQSAFCHGHADTSGPALFLCNTNTLPPYAPLSFCLHHSSLSGAGLDDGVPVEVVLDVFGRHAAYLEVSSRHHMLLVHLSVMACHSGASTAHGRHMRISRRTHHWTQALSRVHVHVSCVDVWVGLWMHGAVAHWRLHCPLWLDSCASKELIDGGAEVCNLSGLERPVIQLRLPHTLFQTLEGWQINISPVVAAGDAAAFF